VKRRNVAKLIFGDKSRSLLALSPVAKRRKTGYDERVMQGTAFDWSPAGYERDCSRTFAGRFAKGWATLGVVSRPLGALLDS
jgi:hypothetical protein